MSLKLLGSSRIQIAPALFLFSTLTQAEWGSILQNGLDRVSETTQSAWSAVASSEQSEVVAPVSVGSHLPKDRAIELWDQFNDYYKEITELKEKQEGAPESGLFVKTKADYQEKIEQILAQFALVMDDPTILKSREQIEQLKKAIVQSKNEISDRKAKLLITAGADQENQTSQIKRLEVKIAEDQSTIQQRLSAIQQRLAGYGMALSNEQVEVLLARVDAGDIVGMIAIFAVISEMTQQLSQLTASSGENLEAAKKYYAMYLILIELQIHIQNSYIINLKERYMTSIQEIKNRNLHLITETKELMQKASSESNKKIYKTNLDNQQYNLKVIDYYLGMLNDNFNKLNKAMVKVVDSYTVALNTYKTVTVSSIILAVMQENNSLYHQVMSLQTPELVPFENLKMKEEFEKLSSQIQSAK